MRLFSALVLSCFFSAPVWAAPSYRYICRLDGMSKEIEVLGDSMAVFNQYDGAGRGRRGTVIFDNHGLQSGRGKMKDRLVFEANYKASEVAPGDVRPFHLSPDLTTGGLQLHNGSLVGFMSFAGHGYRWETYVCFRHT